VLAPLVWKRDAAGRVTLALVKSPSEALILEGATVKALFICLLLKDLMGTRLGSRVTSEEAYIFLIQHIT